MDMGWKTSNGQQVSVQATGLYIDGEFLEDAPPQDADRSL